MNLTLGEAEDKVMEVATEEVATEAATEAATHRTEEEAPPPPEDQAQDMGHSGAQSERAVLSSTIKRSTTRYKYFYFKEHFQELSSINSLFTSLWPANLG